MKKNQNYHFCIILFFSIIQFTILLCPISAQNKVRYKLGAIPPSKEEYEILFASVKS